MNKNVVLKNNLVCTTAIVNYINNEKFNKAYLKYIEYKLMVRADINGGKLTEDDIREALGFEKY